MKYDILVIGSGIAGMMAAIEAKELGSNVAIVTKKSPMANNSFMAKGGINAALNNMQDDDSIEHHIQDTIKGGMGLAEEEAVRIFCEQAPQVVRDLHRKFQVPFNTLENGKLAQRPFGGTKFKRTAFYTDSTGPAIMKALNKALKDLKIDTLKNMNAMNLIKNGSKIAGVSFIDKDENLVFIEAKTVVMATGGYAGLFKGYTTNVSDATGDGIAMGLRAGLEGMDMEFIQYHPTGLAGTNYLVSEAARGEGGRLINSDGKEFVDELNTRDFVTRAIVKQLQRGKQVFLDLTNVDEEIINTKLINLKKRVKSLKGIDITKEPIPLNPLAHYSMGGIKTDTYCTTDIEGLYFAGEAGNNGVNGANRLGGNSLSEGAVFGKLAGYQAVKFSNRNSFIELPKDEIQKNEEFFENLKNKTMDAKVLKNELAELLFNKVGIIRNGYAMKKALEIFESLKTKEFENDSSIKEKLEVINGIDVAIAMTKSALLREESRGSHFRLDFPESDYSFLEHTFVKI